MRSSQKERLKKCLATPLLNEGGAGVQCNTWLTLRSRPPRMIGTVFRLCSGKAPPLCIQRARICATLRRQSYAERRAEHQLHDRTVHRVWWKYTQIEAVCVQLREPLPRWTPSQDRDREIIIITSTQTPVRGQVIRDEGSQPPVEGPSKHVRGRKTRGMDARQVSAKRPSAWPSRRRCITIKDVGAVHERGLQKGVAIPFCATAATRVAIQRAVYPAAPAGCA